MIECTLFYRAPSGYRTFTATVESVDEIPKVIADAPENCRDVFLVRENGTIGSIIWLPKGQRAITQTFIVKVEGVFSENESTDKHEAECSLLGVIMDGTGYSPGINLNVDRTGIDIKEF